jgi:hypothetical protein
MPCRCSSQRRTLFVQHLTAQQIPCLQNCVGASSQRGHLFCDAGRAKAGTRCYGSISPPPPPPPPVVERPQVMANPSVAKSEVETREWFTGIVILMLVTIITALLSTLQVLRRELLRHSVCSVLFFSARPHGNIVATILHSLKETHFSSPPPPQEHSIDICARTPATPSPQNPSPSAPSSVATPTDAQKQGELLAIKRAAHVGQCHFASLNPSFRGQFTSPSGLPCLCRNSAARGQRGTVLQPPSRNSSLLYPL